MSRPFNEQLYRDLESVLREAGFPLTGPQQDRLNRAVKTLADTIERNARQEAVRAVKRLQEAVSTGFERLETDMKRLEGKNED